MLSLARQADDHTMAKAHYIKTLGGFVDAIQTELDHQRTKRLVLAVSLKDKGSALHVLGADLLRYVVQNLWQPEILRWGDVMQEFLMADTAE